MSVLICRSNPVAPDPRVEKIAGALSAQGIPVSVLAWDRTGKLPAAETRPGYTIRRLSIQAEYARGVGNLPALLRWQQALLTWLLRNRASYDVIHACDFDTILPALLCKLLGGKTIVYDIFDFYADHLRATPSWLKTAIRRIDLWAIRQADALILADESRREQIAGTTPRRLVVVYNTPPDLLDQVVPATRPAGTHLHLAYIGLLQVERGLLEMMDVLRRHPEWSLDLAGFGGDQELILTAARGLPNLVWHGRVPYERALELSAAADVLFATYDPEIPNHRFSSPNKLFEAMMLGKPVLVCQGTNMDRLVTENDFGLVIPYGDLAALEEALQRLYADEVLRHHLAQNARRAYQETYTWERMETRLRDLYTTLLAHPS
jgi:glycosyltransferase involved in cell wall biosynthesis